MKTRNLILSTLLILSIISCKKDDFLKRSEEYLSVDLPIENMELIYSKHETAYTDYTKYRIYKVLSDDMKVILDSLKFETVRKDGEHENYWLKNNEIYSFETWNPSDDDRTIFEATLINKEGFNLILLTEIKW